MALTQLELNTVSKGLATAKKILEDIKPVVDAINIIYDSADGAKTTITQAGLDEVSSFSGITKAQLDDMMYSLTAVLRVDINNNYTQLMQGAARA